MSTEKTKILLVDDEPDILEFISYNLTKEGFEVFTSGNGKDAIRLAQLERPHLIILDVMMPDLDGIETCRVIREIPEMKDVLIAFLTARNEDYSQIAGFDAGADDYINKPIKPRVLVSRVKALLRRKGNVQEEEVMDVNGFMIDREKYLIVKDNVQINLPKKEFELIALLASRPGKVFTREDILKNVWGDDVVVGDRTIDVHIRKLREKLGDAYIRTIKGVGYKFEF
ncbi:MAG TPA: response regulator transcription factor [Flavobacteriales bacterium]|jgi:two-component system alkaline phosphatase synthesis response regulator PhoP|nr:response regulator transcription factor [Flavobacteriales bacterium]HPH82958.1 response regulator transcription factor [Flavobacteriales bacterium]